MRLRSLLMPSMFVLCVSISVRAQQPQSENTDSPKSTPPAESQPATAKPAAPEKWVIKDGSDVHLKFAQDLSSKTATEGDTVNLVLDQDIKDGDTVLVKTGAKAVGSISHSKKAGMLGKAGELNMRLEYLIVGDSRMKLRGSKGKEGEGKEGTAVALTVLFGPIGLIKHGKNVEIKEGTPLLAYADETLTIPASK